MSIASTTVKQSYVADGANDTFAIPFIPVVKGDETVEVTVYIRDESTNPATVTLQVEGALQDYTLSGAILPTDFNTDVVFNSPPAAGLIVTIISTVTYTQPLDLSNNGSLNLETLELYLDRMVRMIQQLSEKFTRVPLLGPTAQVSEAGMTMPDPEGEAVLGWNQAGTALKNYTPTQLALSATSINGARDLEYDNTISGLTAENVQDAIDELSAGEKYAYEGFSARFNAPFSSTDLDDTLSKILNIQYTPPLVSLSATGSSTVREKGDAVTATTLTATITKRSDPIAEVRFYDQTNGNTLLDTQTSGGGIPNGGTSTYSWTGSFDDNQIFRVEVDDDGSTGGPTTVSATVSFTFVYPYYVGAGSSSLAAADVANLTKRVITESTNRTETITAGAGEVFYFAYPASYGTLSSILDVNGFETLPDWTLRVENITGLDGNSVSYNIYEFKNPVTAGDYEYRFIQ